MVAPSLAFGILVFIFMSVCGCGQATEECPEDYSRRENGQCVTDKVRALPIREVNFARGSSRKTRIKLDDNRLDPALRLHSTKETFVRAVLGEPKATKPYQVVSVDIEYKNPTNKWLYVKVSDGNGNYASGYIRKKSKIRNNSGVLRMKFKTDGERRVPNGSNFKITIPKASRRIKLTKLSFRGGLTPSDARKETDPPDLGKPSWLDVGYLNHLT